MTVADEITLMREHIARLGRGKSAAVIDFGTRGVRIIVGPQIVPAEINKDTFRMMASRPNVGLDVVNRTLPPKAKSLAHACSVIRKWRDLLRSEGVPKIDLISTAWFRWLDNRAEISRFVAKRTGLNIEYMEQQREAELAMLSLPVLVERWRGQRKSVSLSDDDTIVLIDQGGGSLQVTWMRWRDRLKNAVSIESSQFHDLGTVARRREFFWRSAEGEMIDDPLGNKAPIRTQIKRARKAAQDDLRKDLSLPSSARCKPGKIHVFALGSAITELAPKGGVHNRHNYVLSMERIEQRLDEYLHQLNADGEQVRSIWRGMRLPAKDQTDASRPWHIRRDDLDDTLTALFGLPVYLEVLQQADVNELTVSGYGLAYGYFLHKYASKPQTAEAAAPDDRGPYLFASYCREDRATVDEELAVLRGLRVRSWYDRDIPGGDIFSKTIANRIANSAGVVVFLTPRSVKSDWVEKEVDFALAENKLVIPILLENFRLPTHWRMKLVRLNCIQPWELGPDGYPAKLLASIPKKCLRPALAVS